MTTQLETLSAKAQLEEAQSRLELAEAQHILKLIESPQPVVVPWQEYPGFESFNGSGLAIPYIYSDITDRIEDRYLPYYRNNQDLRRMRARGRNMEAFFPIAVGARDTLTDYVISKGCKVETQPKPGGSEELAKIAQKEIDKFLDHNNFVGAMDREIHEKSRVEGECFPTLYEEDDQVRCELTEPDAIQEPVDKRSLERYLRAGSKLNHWWLGVHTQHSMMLKRDDVCRPLGYHAVFDALGDDWDYLPANRVEHIKRNVGHTARRGWGDYEVIIEDLEQLYKIKRNTAVGAAILAAIVLIRQHAPGTSKSSIESMVGNSSTYTRQQQVEGGYQNRVGEHVSPGTIKDTPSGMETMLGPMGTLRSPVYLEVAQFLMRIIGVRWRLTEYGVSGDASNNNLNSATKADEASGKAREGDQGFYTNSFESLMWKVLGLRVQAGAFGRITLEKLKEQITLKVTLPDVASKDTKEMADKNTALNKAGVKSKRTWSGELGLNYDEEQKEIKDENKVDIEHAKAMAAAMPQPETNPNAPQQQPNKELANQVREEYERQERAYVEVLEHCGANKKGGGGFVQGNTCGGEGGGASTAADRDLSDHESDIGGWDAGEVSDFLPSDFDGMDGDEKSEAIWRAVDEVRNKTIDDWCAANGYTESELYDAQPSDANIIGTPDEVDEWLSAASDELDSFRDMAKARDIDKAAIDSGVKSLESLGASMGFEVENVYKSRSSLSTYVTLKAGDELIEVRFSDHDQVPGGGMNIGTGDRHGESDLSLVTNKGSEFKEKELRSALQSVLDEMDSLTESLKNHNQQRLKRFSHKIARRLNVSV